MSRSSLILASLLLVAPACRNSADTVPADRSASPSPGPADARGASTLPNSASHGTVANPGNSVDNSAGAGTNAGGAGNSAGGANSGSNAGAGAGSGVGPYRG